MIHQFESGWDLEDNKRDYMVYMYYVRVDWPESQAIMDWKEEYQNQTFLIDEAGYMVPKDLWEKYISNPESLNRESESKLNENDPLLWSKVVIKM